MLILQEKSDKKKEWRKSERIWIEEKRVRIEYTLRMMKIAEKIVREESFGLIQWKKAKTVVQWFWKVSSNVCI